MRYISIFLLVLMITFVPKSALADSTCKNNIDLSSSVTDQDKSEKLIQRLTSAFDQWLKANFIMDLDQETTQNVTYTTPDGQVFPLTINLSDISNIKIISENDYTWNLEANIANNSSSTAAQGTIHFNIDAEVRVVDNRMYVKAQYKKNDPSLQLLPSDWVTVRRTQDWPMFDVLNLQAFTKPDRLLVNLVKDRTFASLAIKSITVKTVKTQDGKSVDQIQVEYDVIALLKYDPNILLEGTSLNINVLLDYIDTKNTSYIVIYELNDSDEVVNVNARSQLSFIDAPVVDLLGSENILPGTTISSTTIGDSCVTVNQINDPTLKPTTKP